MTWKKQTEQVFAIFRDSSSQNQPTLLVGPHQASLLVLLPAGPAWITGNQVHVRPAVQQKLHQANVAVETGAVQS